MLGHQLDRYPFLIAYLARQYANSEHFAERMTLQHQLVEAVIASLGVLALGWCRSHAEEGRNTSADGVDAWHSRLDKGGITIGAWIMAIRAATKRMGRASSDPVAGVFRNVATRELLRGLEEYQQVRNSYAHGAMPRSSADQRVAVERMHVGVSAIFDRLTPISRLRLGVVRASSSQGRRHRVETELLTATEPFPSRRLESPYAYLEGAVLAFSGDDLANAIELDPYCIWRVCRRCGRNELFYLRQRRHKGLQLKSYYVSFTTGHELLVTGDTVKAAPDPPTALAIPAMDSRAATTAYDWRATWADLAGRLRRLAARTVDLAIMLAVASSGWAVPWLVSAPVWVGVLCTTLLVLAHEPTTAVLGGTVGKRLFRLEPIGCLDGRALSRTVAVRRALLVNLAVVCPPLAVYNLAWLLWDPARQCWHDRGAGCIVVAGRSRPGQKR